MKAVYCLGLLSCMLALCHGACFRELPEAQIIDGKLVEPDGCIDKFDGTKHPYGSHWNTANCLECRCTRDGMNCCDRHGGVVKVEGCIAVLDPKKCRYKFYKKDNPSEPC